MVAKNRIRRDYILTINYDINYLIIAIKSDTKNDMISLHIHQKLIVYNCELKSYNKANVTH